MIPRDVNLAPLAEDEPVLAAIPPLHRRLHVGRGVIAVRLGGEVVVGVMKGATALDVRREPTLADVADELVESRVAGVRQRVAIAPNDSISDWHLNTLPSGTTDPRRSARVAS